MICGYRKIFQDWQINTLARVSYCFVYILLQNQAQTSGQVIGSHMAKLLAHQIGPSLQKLVKLV